MPCRVHKQLNRVLKVPCRVPELPKRVGTMQNGASCAVCDVSIGTRCQQHLENGILEEDEVQRA